MPEKPRAIGYTRVSGASQVKGQSLLYQADNIRAHCAAHNLHLVDIFSDPAVRGALPIAERPAFLDTLNAISSGAASVVVVTEMDRFSRDLMTALIAEHIIKEAGGTLVFTRQDTGNLDEPTAKLMRSILAAFGEFEKNLSTARMKAGKDRKFKSATGPTSGRAAYGYTTTGHRGNKVLVPVPHEQEVMRLIRRLRKKNLGYKKIAHILNGSQPWRGEDLSRPTRSGKPWHPQTVKNAITSNHSKNLITRNGHTRKLKPATTT